MSLKSLPIIVAMAALVATNSCSAQDADAACIIEFSTLDNDGDNIIPIFRSYASSNGMSFREKRDDHVRPKISMTLDAQNIQIIAQNTFADNEFVVGFFDTDSVDEAVIEQCNDLARNLNESGLASARRYPPNRAPISGP